MAVLSSAHFGTLTFGRQRALGTDAMPLTIRPAAPTPFRTSGITARWPVAATTEDTRWDNAIKYRLTYVRSISARCINSSTVLAAATPPRNLDRRHLYAGGGA